MIKVVAVYHGQYLTATTKILRFPAWMVLASRNPIDPVSALLVNELQRPKVYRR